MYNKEGDVIAGKDEYLSPEQARREVTDARADLFCCAIVLSELLLGRNIFSEETAEATQDNILNLELPTFNELREDIDPRLEDILQLGFQKPRDKRFQTAFQMLTALEKFIYGDGYGPTNEKLAIYIQDLFGEDGEGAAERWKSGNTPGLEDCG